MKIRLFLFLILLSFAVPSYSQELENQPTEEMVEENQNPPEFVEQNSTAQDQDQEIIQEPNGNIEDISEPQEIKNDEGYGSDDEEYYGSEEESPELFKNQFDK